MSENTNERDDLHIAVCQAMVLMNQSVGVASDEEGLRAKNILREALFNYQPAIYTDNSTVIANMQKTIDELRQQLAQQPSVDVLDAAKAVVERWDTPLWKDVPHTAIFIHKLRDSLQAMNEAKPIEKV